MSFGFYIPQKKVWIYKLDHSGGKCFFPKQTERDKQRWKRVVPNERGRGLSTIRLMNGSVSEHSTLKHKVPFQNIRPPPETSQPLQLPVDGV